MRGYPRNRLVERSDDGRVVTGSARSRGHLISFEDAGSGTAIVLIPGWTMSAADWWDAGYIDHLASSHRVLAVDPLGNGLTRQAARSRDLPMAGCRDRHHRCAGRRSIDRAVVWGYSRGSCLAAVVAAEFPERFSGLILTAGGDMSVDEEAGAGPGPIYEAMWRGDFEPLWDEYAFSEDDRRYDAEVNDPVALGCMGIAWARYGVTFHLGRVTAPALVLVGARNDPVDAKEDRGRTRHRSPRPAADWTISRSSRAPIWSFRWSTGSWRLTGSNDAPWNEILAEYPLSGWGHVGGLSVPFSGPFDNGATLARVKP